MKVVETALPGVLLIEPQVYRDARGAFMETWREARYEFAGRFVQDNLSRSVRGTLRGLHYQLAHPQGKLVQALTGSVYDVAVDIRVGSPTFRRWFGAVLSEENCLQMWIPPGFAHGFLVLSDSALFAYKVTDVHHPGDDCAVRWNDPAVGIEWPLDGAEPLLSARDTVAPLLADARLA